MVAFRRLLPKWAVVECQDNSDGAEATDVTSSTRAAEHRGGRECARRALAQLGERTAEIPTGSRGQPMWPLGFAGSISHCPGLRAAAVGRLDRVRSLGIDVELNRPLRAAVAATIMGDEEASSIRRLATRHGAIAWSTVVWSAKESVFKAWYPLTKQWSDYTDCLLTIDADRGSFSAQIRHRTSHRAAAGRSVTISGRWAIVDRHILTAVSIRPEAGAIRIDRSKRIGFV